MPLDFARARPLLQNCEFKKLFVEELGWEPCRQKLTLRASETDFAFVAVAEKRGFTAWLCARVDGHLPDHATRLKLDRALTQTSFEHLIVFTTSDQAQQSWLWVRREPGRPLSARTHEYTRGQPGDSLLQKLQILYVSLEEEEKGELSTVTMAGRARAAFDIERVTKAFHRDFDTHRKAFLKFIDGIGEVADREWYASVMLNRLMFVYFIQRKGFLDADHDYLRNRLDRCKKEQGKDKFYTFYRYFLIRLFHEGFGKRRKDRALDLEKLLGNIPYLNGGLFDVHELEKPERYGKEIQIPDKAFERIFDYFESYDWVLDPQRTVKKPGDKEEINPDVLGYIFEKYINQKQMGAYYTKEDITEYISKNTVLPFLFDAARKACRVAFDGGRSRRQEAQTGNSELRDQKYEVDQSLVTSAATPTVWDLLRDDPDRYIYPAVRHGTDKKLPPEIAAGLDTTKPNLIERRKGWNKPAPSDYALPTEIWREVVARRQRYFELRARLVGGTGHWPVPSGDPPDGTRRASNKLAAPVDKGSSAPVPLGGSPSGAGGSPAPPITDINDFITLNLDLRQFAQDVIQNCEGPDLLIAFWQAISTITVLDPTGGSGAFIFAALNILEPLYEGCLDRMEAFLAEWGENGRKAHPNYHKKFTEVLARVDAHPNRRYFVLKSIILNNLYAVDIMEEAVEICKLRLFLKLAAQVEPDAARDNLGIEPLPDIDFNIRAGNTLVGYATADEVRKCMTEFGSGQMRLGVEDELQSFTRFTDKLQIADAAFRSFRQQQTELGGTVTAKDKVDLRAKLKVLEDELNRYLARDYGVKVSDQSAFNKWLHSHKPFHWFIEFYGILTGGGFDVIVGNPPYVAATKVRKTYAVRNLATDDCTDIYAWVLERSQNLLRTNGRTGMIVPLSLGFSGDFDSCRRLLFTGYSDNWFSSFGRIPAALFNFDVRVRNTIHLALKSKRPAQTHMTRLHRWFEAARSALFQTLEYAPFKPALWKYRIPKLNTAALAHAFERALGATTRSLNFVTSPRATKHVVHFKKTAYNWLNFCREMPPCYEGSRRVSHTQFDSVYFPEAATQEIFGLLCNGKLMMVFWFAVGDDFHVTRWSYGDFPADLSTLSEPHRTKLRAHTPELEKAMEAAIQFKLNAGRRVGNYNLAKCRDVTDLSDRILAEALGFADVWEDIELYYAPTMKTDFSDDEEV